MMIVKILLVVLLSLIPLTSYLAILWWSYNNYKVSVSPDKILITPGGKPVIFLHPKQFLGTLIELEEV